MLLFFTACGPSCPDGAAVSMSDINGAWKIVESTDGHRGEGYVKFENSTIQWFLDGGLVITRSAEPFGDHGVSTADPEAGYEENFCLSLSGETLTMTMIESEKVYTLQKVDGVPGQ